MTLDCVVKNPERLAALHRYEVLDTPAEEAFDRIVRLAKRSLDAPFALLSLIDSDRQWVKACEGLDVAEFSLEGSFCVRTAETRQTLVVPDALADARFRDSPYVVGEPGVRAYAGAPLLSPGGHVIGTLCVADVVPRALRAAHVEVLEDLAAEAVDQLELRLTQRRHRGLFATHPQPMLVYDRETLRILDVNESACARYGYARSAFLGMTVEALRPPEDVPAFREHLARNAERPGRSGPWRHRTASGELLHVYVDAFPVTYEERAARIVHVTDATEGVRARQALQDRERLRTGEIEALRMTAQGAPLDEVLTHVTRLLEAQLPGSRCSVVLLDPSGRYLGRGVGPSLDPAYLALLPGLPVGPAVGSCGTAAWRRETVVTEDVETDPLWKGFRDLVRPYGLRACWSLPICGHDGHCLATFAVYYDTPRRPEPDEMKVVAAVAHLAQVAIERDRDARALVTADARHRALIDALSAMLWKARPCGEIDPDIAGWAAFAGEAEPDADGWLALLHPDDADGARAAWKAAQASGRLFVAEHRLRRRDGAYRTMAAYAVPLRGPGGAVIEWVGVHFDVTAQRRAEAALQASEERFRLVAERMTDVVSIQRPDGTYLWVSPSVEHVFGYTPDEILARSPEQIVHPDDWEAMAARIAAAVLSSAEHFEATCRLRHRAGHYVWIESRGRLVRDARGRVTTMQLVSRDITERRRYEAELVAAREDALEAARLKSALLANMSHEIRTPLTGIIGFADLLADAADDDTREFAERIAASGQRLMDTLNSVLDLAQLEAGALRFEPVPVDVSAEVRGVAALLQARAAARGLALTLDLPEAPLLALGDRAALGRVLANLVGNAIKFTEAGHVALAVRPVAGQQQVEVCVRDTGVGIGPEFLPRLFREFEQESHGHGRRFEGSGLGLAITRRLVDLMGGTIAVESTPGVGTAFTVRLPAAIPDRDTSPDAPGDGQREGLPALAARPGCSWAPPAPHRTDAAPHG
ncbi:MAG: PAS domain-containing protein [Rubricoccaceae bacterium]